MTKISYFHLTFYALLLVNCSVRKNWIVARKDFHFHSFESGKDYSYLISIAREIVGNFLKVSSIQKYILQHKKPDSFSIKYHFEYKYFGRFFKKILWTYSKEHNHYSYCTFCTHIHCCNAEHRICMRNSRKSKKSCYEHSQVFPPLKERVRKCFVSLLRKLSRKYWQSFWGVALLA